MSKLIPLVLLLACPAFSGTLTDTAQSPVSFAIGAPDSLPNVSFLSEAWERLSHAVNVKPYTEAIPTPDEESLLDRLLRASLLYS
jgi:hypothetical protein